MYEHHEQFVGLFRKTHHNRQQPCATVPDSQRHSVAPLAILQGDFRSAIWLDLDVGWQLETKEVDVYT